MSLPTRQSADRNLRLRQSVGWRSSSRPADVHRWRSRIRQDALRAQLPLLWRDQIWRTGVFVSFEERPDELIKNVASLNFRLDELINEKKFAIDHVRIDRTEIEETGGYDLEELFVRLDDAIDSIGAKRVVLDSI
jgi:hypothetical protein